MWRRERDKARELAYIHCQGWMENRGWEWATRQMLSLRAISECQHFCPTPALPLRYFLNAAFVMRGATVRRGLYLAGPESGKGDCVDFFCIIIFISMLVHPRSACCSHVSHSRTRLFWTPFVSRLPPPLSLYMSCTVDSRRIGRRVSCFCLFHTWATFVFSFQYLTLTQRRTLTHTHTVEYAQQHTS